MVNNMSFVVENRMEVCKCIHVDLINTMRECKYNILCRCMRVIMCVRIRKE